MDINVNNAILQYAEFLAGKALSYGSVEKMPAKQAPSLLPVLGALVSEAMPVKR